MLGEQDRIVGISGYVVRPPQARREKPRVSAFTSANIDKILALKPDLVLTFSDLQATLSSTSRYRRPSLLGRFFGRQLRIPMNTEKPSARRFGGGIGDKPQQR